MSFLLIGCATNDIYYGTSPHNPSMHAKLRPCTSKGNMFACNLFYITEVDGQKIPCSDNTGYMGLQVYLDPTPHNIRIQASRATPLCQIVGGGNVRFTPSAGKEYVGGGTFTDDKWTLWIEEKITGHIACSPVIVDTRKAGPVKGPDLTPVMMGTTPR